MLSGLFGIGGGVVIVAALVGLAKFPIHKATGTSLVALLLPVGLLGVAEYWRAGHVDLRAGGIIAVGLFLGAWFGAKLAQHVNSTTMQRGFAIFLVVIAVRMWIEAGR